MHPVLSFLSHMFGSNPQPVGTNYLQAQQKPNPQVASHVQNMMNSYNHINAMMSPQNAPQVRVPQQIAQAQVQSQTPQGMPFGTMDILGGNPAGVNSLQPATRSVNQTHLAGQPRVNPSMQAAENGTMYVPMNNFGKPGLQINQPQNGIRSI